MRSWEQAGSTRGCGAVGDEPDGFRAEPGTTASSGVLLFVGLVVPLALRGYFGTWDTGQLFAQGCFALIGAAGVHGVTEFAPERRARLVAGYGYIVVAVIAIGLVLTSVQTVMPYVAFGATSLAVLAGAPTSRWRRALLALTLLPSLYWCRASTVPWLPGGVVPAVFDASADDVVAVDLAPDDVAEYSLIHDPVIIGDPETVEQILEALAAAKPMTLNHPKTEWRVVLAIRYEDRLVKTNVSATDQGVLVAIESAGHLRLAERRADALRELLEPFANEQR